MSKKEEVDPNLEAVLTRLDQFIPVLVMLMTKNCERQELRAQADIDPEVDKSCQERCVLAAAEEAEASAATAKERLTQAETQTAALQVVMSELSTRVAGLGAQDNPVPVRDLADAFKTIQGRGY